MKTKQPVTWKTEKRNVKDLLPAGYNPRTMMENERRDLEQSIKTYGTVVPVVLNTGSRKNVLIGGHQRAVIYADLGIETIDAMVPSRELSEQEEKELNLRLNKNTGSWDSELLKELDMDLLLQVGFGDDELQALFDDVDVLEDDFDVEKAVKETKAARTKSGDLWQLGRHRLLVGDSTNADNLQRLMGNDLADVIYHDPPYNIGFDYSKGVSTTGKYEGAYTETKDSKKDTAYAAFIDASMKASFSFARPNAHFFYWCDERYIWLLQTLYKQNAIDSKRVCLWIKNNFNATPQVAFNKAYEPCVYGTCGTPKLNKSITTASELWNKEIGTGNQAHDDILDIFNLWLERKDATQSYDHPTQKPIGLAEKPLKRCSVPGDIVLSGFAGGGSDLIACEQLNRVWRGMEIDPIFATVCIDRWEAYTNEKATLL